MANTKSAMAMANTVSEPLAPFDAGGGAFPVKVEAILAFVLTPEDAFKAITNYVRENSPARDDEYNEGVKFSFSFAGIRHDVTLTRED